MMTGGLDIVDIWPSRLVKVQSRIDFTPEKLRVKHESVENFALSMMQSVISVAPKRLPSKSHMLKFDKLRHVLKREAFLIFAPSRLLSDRLAPVRLVPVKSAPGRNASSILALLRFLFFRSILAS